jgi:mannose-1-phosphate guanylyltransferase
VNTLVLAAGKSTRIASVSDGLPKPLLPVAGETILGRNLRWLASEGIRHVWINLHYRPEDVRRAIGDGKQFGLTVEYVYEPEILGTAGAVRNLSGDCRSTVLVVYGDNLLNFELKPFVAYHQAKGAAATIALFDQRMHVHTGIAGGRVLLGSDGQVKQFIEGATDAQSSLVNAGVYLLEPDVVRDIPAGQFHDFGRDFFPALLAEGRRLDGYLISGYCLGIDTPESYRRVLDLVATGKVSAS